MMQTLHSKSSPRPWLWLWVVLLSAVTQVAYADRLKDDQYYKVTEHTDHVTLEILIADGKSTDTWCEWGSVRAYSENGRKGTVYHIMDVETDHHADDSENWEFYAQTKMPGSRAWLTNTSTGVEQEIGPSQGTEWRDRTGNVRYIMYKGKDNLYPTVKIDFYYGPEMAGKKWYFYYEYKHNKGSSHNMSMGGAYCSDRMGLGSINTRDFSYTREGIDKIKFTVPGMPDDVPSKLKSNRWHEGFYHLFFTYTLQDGSIKKSEETLECQTGNSKTYEIAIPEDVGNFKKLDLSIEVLDQLKCENDKNFYSSYCTYLRKSIFPTVPVPLGLSAEYLQFDNKADLSWNAFPTGESNYIEASIPYIYRVETDKNGDPLSGQTWNRRTSLNAIGTTQAQGYTDANVSANKYYKYMVVNVPKEWIDNHSIQNSDLNSPSEKLLFKLGYTVSDVLGSAPDMSIYNLRQDTTVTDKVRIVWEYSRVPVSTKNITFQIMSREKGKSEWINYGTVTGPANPTSDDVISFTDNTLPNARSTYQYKIVLSINNGTNTFESDVLTAGLLSGTIIRTVSATKGTHENVVRVSWTVKHVGTDNTNYEVYRRYAGTTGEYLKVHSVSGHSDSYTYEDNTVQPGYYYEYKVDAYSGDKQSSADNTYQNTLSDVGFCQARGVISGKVSFGSGNAVDNVRLSLRSNASDDGNVIRGYSQRVDGVSAGIKWDADSAETAAILGANKDYTLQLFIRPDDNLANGTVIGEIPHFGRLLIGNKKEGGYQLLAEKYTEATNSENQFTEYWDIQCVFQDDTSKDNNEPSYYNEELGTWMYNTDAEFYGKCDDLSDNEGYKKIYNGWFQLSPRYIWFAVYGKVVPISGQVHRSHYTWQGKVYDTGLTLPANSYSLISLQNEGQRYIVSVNDQSKALPDATSSSKSHSLTDGNLELLSDDFYFYGENCLYKVTGCTNETMLQGHESVYTTVFGEWFPDMSIAVTKTTEAPCSFAMGGGIQITEEEAFKGNLTEVRVWDHILTQKERDSYTDRVLNGHEAGLKLYWPMDEGIDHLVFDASYTNDLPNGRHATVGNNITSSTTIPTDAQLSRYGVTNEQGEFTIRGIPFVGSGTTYTIVPSKGIHVFSPVSRNGFIGNGSLALNNYDFTDQSAFPVRGKVTYLNTNIPADSIQFKIDGALVQAKDSYVMTDANGEYEISVPIGKHLIEAWKDGHRLTSFPLDGTTYDFKQDEIVNFFDSTLVNVTGRINGGFTDQDEPVGFGRSVNRIGKAVVKLSLGKESQCSFNYIVNDRGEGSFGTTNLPVESATDKIQSTAYRAGGSHDDTYYIYITTDEKTGEFSAMLPPLRYKVESINFVGGKDYDNEPVFAQNLPFIDATNTVEKAMQTDSLTVDGIKMEYTYTAKMNRQLRKEPTITVEQVGMKNGAFGEEKIALSNIGATDSVAAITFTDTGYQYNFGHPLFVQEGVYEYDIAVSEDYVNLDTRETFHEIPKDAMVTIINDASALTTVIAEKAIINGEEAQIGEAYDTPSINVIPDENGHVSYQFVGGWPNLAEGNLRNMSIGVKVDGRTTMWQAPDSESNALDMILLGAITSGTNFMTQGPDDVDMILRRPPGSTSEAVYINEKVNGYTKTDVNIKNGHGHGGGANVVPSPVIKTQWGEVTPITGITLLFENKVKIVLESQHTGEYKWWDTENFEDEYTYTVTNEIHGTTEGIQNNGDTYIGRSTNLLFGKGWNLGIYKQSDGTYKIESQEGITLSESFGTYFAYPQEYIEETLIPNWEAIIRNRLEHVDGNHWEDGNHETVPGVVKYYTKYKEGDLEWGRTNGDSHWTKAQFDEAKGCPSYIMVDGTNEHPDDEVEFAINQIKNWRHIIEINEQDKVEAFEDKSCFIDNYSIANGTSISQTVTTETRHLNSYESNYEYAYNTENKIGALFNEMGAYGIITGTIFHGNSSKKDTTTIAKTSVAWTLSDADPRTALSVDVFKSKNGYGPIFRTRGGQTANPYEDATFTKYYNEGTKLDEATMRVELPQLKVVGQSQVSNVPTGGEAKFDLELFNRSETNSNCTYILEAIESSNAQGAVLTIDGAPLSLGKTGRAISMNGGETIHKMLYVSQSDRSITEFKDLKLVLRSEKDESTCSDTLHLSIEFVPASAIIEMSVAHTVLNMEDLRKYKGFQVTLTNFDRQDNNLEGVRVQYRRKGFDSWNLAHQWKVNEADLEQGDSLIRPTDKSLECSVAFPSDGIYELRGQTWGKYGKMDVTYETPIIEVTQDTRGPKVLGMPSHDNGTLTYSTRGNMWVRFNEHLNANALSKSDNFTIEGFLNNVAVKKQYTDVAVQLNGDELRTQSTFTMTDDDLAVGFWFYRQSDGNIVNLGIGEDVLTLFTHDGGKLGLRSGNEEVTQNANVKLPANQWNYIAMTYKRKNTNDPDNRFTMLFANAEADRPTYMAENIAAPDLNGNVRIGVGGDGMKGMIHELTLWNIDKSAQELYETRNEKKANYTPGLIGYWRMNEGHGTLLTDNVRSRHIQMPTESWYINNRNLAAHINGTPLKLDNSTFSPRQSDNYAMEMWFRADKEESNQNAKLLSILNAFSIGFSEGKLVLEKSTRSVDNDNVETKTVETTIVLSDSSYIDNNWHHFALNVHRGTSAIAYIDGQAVKTIAESTIPGLSAHYIYVGGEQTLVGADGSNLGGSTNNFIGDVDEIRLWGTALTGSLIEERRYERMEDGNYSLYGYFPMESIGRDKSGNVQTEFSTDNFGYRESQMKMEGTVTKSENAPALLPGSSRMRLDDKQFDFTVADDIIYFNFPEDVLPLMDGNEFVIKVENIKDEHNNTSEAVEWKFNCDFALFSVYAQEENEKLWSETATFPLMIYNDASSLPTTYEVSGMPRWLKVSEPIGTITDYADLECTILPSVPVGRYTDYIYVTDRLGISRSQRIHLTVKGDEPNWAVNPDLYESNMTLTGQIYVGDKISQNTDSKIAAFDFEGNCRGVAQPHYVNTRDAYYFDMIIYGASATEISNGQRPMYFQLYDASSGITYPVVDLLMPDGILVYELTYSPDAYYGSYDKPVICTATDNIAESSTLPRGWTWMSLYVEPYSTDINNVLAMTKNERKKYQNIKSKTAIATPDVGFTSFIGTLQELTPGNMYKVQVSASTNLNIYGTIIDVEKATQTIYPGFNWIGSLSNTVLSLEDAFADLQPKKDDMVKTRTAMSVYNGQGIWEGTLKSIVPGVGYIYLSQDALTKTFHYPKYDYGGNAYAQSISFFEDGENVEDNLYYQPVDDHRFPDNMNIIAVVQLDGESLDDAEVGAFANGECRGAVKCIDGYYFLTIMGSSVDDVDTPFELRVYHGGNDYVITDLRFISDAVYGTLEEPYVIDLNSTGIRDVNFDDDDTEWYTLEGFKIGRRPTKSGVYIHRGQKVTVRSMRK